MPIHPDEQRRSAPVGEAQHATASLGGLATAAARRGGQRPFVTFYDERTGERTELGHATLHNWVSKAANLFTDEFDLGPGCSLDVRLGTHWTTLVVLLAAWRCGIEVRRGPAGEPPPEADASVRAEDDAAAIGDPARTLVVGTGLGGRLTGDAGGALGFAEEVLACADEFDDPGVTASTPALVEGGPQTTALTHGDLLGLASAAVAALELGAGGRILVPVPLETLGGATAVLAALAAGASVVLVAGGSDEVVERRAREERCDVVLRTLTIEHGPGGAPAGVEVVTRRGGR